jgi:hypothetical protein
MQGMQNSLCESRSEIDRPPAYCAAHPWLGRDECVQLRAEEVDPEILVHWDPQESLTDADKRWPPTKSRWGRSCAVLPRSGSTVHA